MFLFLVCWIYSRLDSLLVWINYARKGWLRHLHWASQYYSRSIYLADTLSFGIRGRWDQLNMLWFKIWFGSVWLRTVRQVLGRIFAWRVSEGFSLRLSEGFSFGVLEGCSLGFLEGVWLRFSEIFSLGFSEGFSLRFLERLFTWVSEGFFTRCYWKEPHLGSQKESHSGLGRIYNQDSWKDLHLGSRKEFHLGSWKVFAWALGRGLTLVFGKNFNRVLGTLWHQWTIQAQTLDGAVSYNGDQNQNQEINKIRHQAFWAHWSVQEGFSPQGLGRILTQVLTMIVTWVLYSSLGIILNRVLNQVLGRVFSLGPLLGSLAGLFVSQVEYSGSQTDLHSGFPERSSLGYLLWFLEDLRSHSWLLKVFFTLVLAQGLARYLWWIFTQFVEESSLGLSGRFSELGDSFGDSLVLSDGFSLGVLEGYLYWLLDLTWVLALVSSILTGLHT